MSDASALDGTLFYGDNLTVLREEFPDDSVDLIYLDPPFNSNASYNVLFKDESGNTAPSQIRAFEDTWHWGPDAVDALLDLNGTTVGNLLNALADSLGENQLTAYLCMMGVRLVELRRVLKPTGNILLHCDTTAGHYLKIVMDTVFERDRFRNHIVWRRAHAKGLATRRFPRNQDWVLVYEGSPDAYWGGGEMFVPYDMDQLDSDTLEQYRHQDADGRRYQLSDLTNPNKDRPNLTYEFLGVTRVWRWTRERMQQAYDEGRIAQARPGAVPRLKRYLDEQRGRPMDEIWTDIGPLGARDSDRRGYPTQKPPALLDRIITVASRPGDLVLDPFCGCGTAVVSAERLGRRWAGIDITHLAVGIVEDWFHEIGVEPRVVGAPQDLASARDLGRRDPFQFEAWAIQRLRGFRPNERQRGDGGIDGRMRFRKTEGRRRPDGLAVAQVKSGRVGPGDVQAFRGALADANADLGVFVVMGEVSDGVHAAARRAGRVTIGDHDYPAVQVWSLADYFEGRLPDLPIPASWERRRLL